MRLARQVFTALLIGLPLVACGSQDESKKDSAPASDGGSGNATKKKKQTTQETDGEGDDADTGGEDDDATDDAATDGGTSGAANSGTGAAAGAAFFNDVITPLFQANCVTCHADPRQAVQVRGPLTIYAYNNMKALLKQGAGSLDNGLINKVAGVVDHGGVNRCTGGIDKTPCKEISDWWRKEFGDDGASGKARVGVVTDVSSLGRVLGWAADQADLTKPVTVNFYLDGPMGTGTMIGSTVADKDGSDNNTAGAHAFIFDLPATARDKKQRKLYATAMIGGKETPINTDGFQYIAYNFSDAGRTYYRQNVQGQLTACQACHTVSYEQQFYSLISPAPNKGGTAGNNQLVNKSAQINGVTHGGGMRCNGGAMSGVCASFQAWWTIEFGVAP